MGRRTLDAREALGQKQGGKGVLVDAGAGDGSAGEQAIVSAGSVNKFIHDEKKARVLTNTVGTR